MEKTYEAPSNEAPHMILGYHQGRLMTYLLCVKLLNKLLSVSVSPRSISALHFRYCIRRIMFALRMCVTALGVSDLH